MVGAYYKDDSVFDRGGAAYTFRLEIFKGDMDENQITDGLDLEMLAENLGSLSCSPL